MSGKRKQSKKSSRPTSKHRNEILQRANYVCEICGEPGTKDNPLTIHHMVAKSRGGTNSPENLVVWHRIFHQNYHKRFGTHRSDRQGRPI